MLDSEFYDLTQSLSGALYLAMIAVRQQAEDTPVSTPSPLLQIQSGMAESPGWFLIQAAEFEPDPLTVTDLRRRDVYASPRIVQAMLEIMAAAKWFDRQEDSYYLTEAGRSILRHRQQQREQGLADLDPLITCDIACLERQLNRIIRFSLDCDDPPGTWCLAHSRRRAPSNDAALSVKLFQYVADINAFRDDAHMAAWRPQGIPGYTWEAFSLVCAGQAGSAAGLYAQLAHRGYSRHDYGLALQSLAGRGWLETAEEAAFRVTTRGRAIRQEVEKLTDLYFFAPWHAALDDDEITGVGDLMVQLRQELKALAS